MRWAVMFLVVVNLAVYFWLTQGQKTQSEKQYSKQLINVDYDSVSSLRFVGESNVVEPRHNNASSQDERIALLPASGGRRSVMCRYMGPFAEKISAKQVALRLSNNGSNLVINKHKEEIEPLYWVYYPPLGNAQLALRKLREFQSQQIDSFLVTKGAYTNAISLGYFSKKASAIAVRDSIEDAGYDAKMMTKKRFKDQFWIDLEQLSGSDLSREKIDQASSGYPEVAIQKKLCKTVASN